MKVIIYFLFFIFSFNFPPKIRNVPKTNGINPIKLIANVDGSNAIEDILLYCFLFGHSIVLHMHCC